jgi:hypothetical protein
MCRLESQGGCGLQKKIIACLLRLFYTVTAREFLGVTCRRGLAILRPSTPVLRGGAKRAYGKKVFEILSQEEDNACAMIDATIVRAHQHSAGAKKKTAIKPLDGALEV